MKKKYQKILNNLEIIKLITSSKPKFRITLIKNLNKESIICLLEIILNTLKGNIKLNKTLRQYLTKFKSNLRNLAKKFKIKSQIHSKRKQLIKLGLVLVVICKNFLKSSALSKIQKC